MARDPNTVKAGIITTLLIAGMGTWAVLAGAKWPASKPAEPPNYLAPARAACAQFVERLARNAASVEHLEQWDWPTTDNGDGTLSVLMHYRAQNGFGGMNRERRACKVARTGDNYRLVTLSDPI